MDAAYEKKLRVVKGIVLTIAAVVGLILCGTVYLGYHYYAYDRPVKELFGHDAGTAQALDR